MSVDEYQKIPNHYLGFECRFNYTDSPFHMGMHLESVIVEDSLFRGKEMVASEYSKWSRASPNEHLIEAAQYEFQVPGSTVFYEWRLLRSFGLKPKVRKQSPYYPHQFVASSHGLQATEETEGKLTRSEALLLVISSRPSYVANPCELGIQSFR